jgi:hypothetical protein
VTCVQRGAPVALVKYEAAVECGAADPVQDLLEAVCGAASAPARAHQRRVREKEDTFLVVLAQAARAHRGVEVVAVINDVDVHAKVGDVTLRVGVQVGRRRQPDVLQAAATVVVEHNACM